MNQVQEVFVNDRYGRPSLHIQIFSLENKNLCRQVQSELEKLKWKPGRFGPYQTTKHPTNKCKEIVAMLKNEIQQALIARGQNETMAPSVLYRKYDEEGFIRPHHDAEFGFNGVIFGVSFGATRTLRMTYHGRSAQMGLATGQSRKHDFVLRSGSLYIIRAPSNRDWKHAILKKAASNDPSVRYSLTFRRRDPLLDFVDRAFGILESFQFGRRNPNYEEAFPVLGVFTIDDLVETLAIDPLSVRSALVGRKIDKSSITVDDEMMGWLVEAARERRLGRAAGGDPGGGNVGVAKDDGVAGVDGVDGDDEGSAGGIVVVDGAVAGADKAGVALMSSSSSQGGWMLEGIGPCRVHNPAKFVDLTDDDATDFFAVGDSSSSSSCGTVMAMGDGSCNQKGRTRADAVDLTSDSAAKKARHT